MPLLQLVANAQKQFSECIGIKKLRIFVLDTDVMRMWHVGSELDANSGLVGLVRRYSNVPSSLCSSVLKPTSSSCVIVEDPPSEATFNDIVDLRGGARGLYLAPITSPWGETSLGMIQVARPAVSSFTPGDDPGFAAAVAREKQSAQAAEDSLTMELIETFARVFAGLLHHVTAQQLYDTCPQEVHNARLAYTTDRLDCLENEYREEEAQNEAKEEQIARTLAATAMMERRFLESAQRERASATRDDEVAVRRVSCTEAVLHSHTSLHVRDSRRISSAGSTRRNIDAVHAEATEVIHRADAEEVDLEFQEDAEADDETSHSGDDNDGGDNDEETADHDSDTGEAGDAIQDADVDPFDTEAGVALAGVGYEGGADCEGGRSWSELQSEEGVDELPSDVIDWNHEQEHEIELPEDDRVDDGAFYQQEQEQERFGELDAQEWQDDEGGGGSWRDEREVEAPVGLISTDSMYGIDLSYSDSSPAELTPGRSDSFSPVDEQPGSFAT